MTDISRHISRLINDVFESSTSPPPPLNGTVIGMLNLLFNRAAEFIAGPEPVSSRAGGTYDWSL